MQKAGQCRQGGEPGQVGAVQGMILGAWNVREMEYGVSEGQACRSCREQGSVGESCDLRVSPTCFKGGLGGVGRDVSMCSTGSAATT